MTHNELTQHVYCKKCGNWEEQPADQSRHHFGAFTIRDYNKNIFTCDQCQSKAISEYIINDESNDYEPHSIQYYRNDSLPSGRTMRTVKEFDEVNIINPITGRYKNWIKCPQDGNRWYIVENNSQSVLF